MRVQDAMTKNATYIPAAMTLDDAARKMRELNSGFLPIADANEKKLQGVVTDRDIVLRAVAEGLDPARTSVEEVKSDAVLLCFQDDDVEKAARHMHDQQIYRLVVLDDSKHKHLCGVITLGDIAREHDAATVGKTAAGIAA